MSNKLDPNNPMDLEIIKEILEDQGVDFNITIEIIEKIEDFEEIRNSTDHDFVAYQVNYWTQIYFDFF